MRRATRGDLAKIMKIERASFSSPWPTSAMEEEIERHAWSRVVLAVDDEQLLGFMVYWLVGHELHLLNLATNPVWRRRGIATSLIEHLKNEARRWERLQIVLEVRESNLAARKLYEGHGFTEIGHRRGYYSDNGEDAVVMALWLGNDTNQFE